MWCSLPLFHGHEQSPTYLLSASFLKVPCLFLSLVIRTAWARDNLHISGRYSMSAGLCWRGAWRCWHKGTWKGCVPQPICVLDILGGLYIISPFPTHVWLLNLHFISPSGDHLIQKSSFPSPFTPIPKLYRQSKGFKCQDDMRDFTPRVPLLPILCDLLSWCSMERDGVPGVTSRTVFMFRIFKSSAQELSLCYVTVLNNTISLFITCAMSSVFEGE